MGSVGIVLTALLPLLLVAAIKWRLLSYSNREGKATAVGVGDYFWRRPYASSIRIRIGGGDVRWLVVVVGLVVFDHDVGT